MAKIVAAEVLFVAEVVLVLVAEVVVLVVAAGVDQIQGISVGWLLPQGKLNFVGQRELPSWVLKKLPIDL